MIAMQFNCNCTCQHQWIAQDMPINCPKCGVRTIAWKRERASEETWEQVQCAGKIVEGLDFIEDQQLGYHLGNAVAYIVRCRWKGNQRDDVKKAIWYLNRYLAESATQGGA